MSSEHGIKEMVREKYGKIAEGTISGCCGSSATSCFSDDYTQLAGYVPDADLGLGCGIPTDIARIKSDDTVLDLGSGAGNDAFVARSLVGDTGRVIGVDMTRSMVEKARANASRLGYENVEFRLGEIETLPVDSTSIDVVISNCVLNLVPDKQKAFAEIWRVLRAGGHFSISDIVSEGELPEAVRKSAEAYCGCVAGAMEREAYVATIRRSGFTRVEIAKQKPIAIPDELIRELLPAEGAEALRHSGGLLTSITVYGEKPTFVLKGSQP
jgi:arsenite methyltransferase